jgi:hypothetical protein
VPVAEREYGTPFLLAAAQATRKGKMKTKIMAVLAVLVASFCLNVAAQTYDTNNVVVSTFAGSGFSGHVDGVGLATMFNLPSAIVVDSSSNLFVWDSNNYMIRKIAPDGTVSTFAGGGNQATGTGTNVNLFPTGTGEDYLAIDKNDSLWLASRPDSSTVVMYQITSSAVVSVFTISIPTENAYSWQPVGLCADSAGNIYFTLYYSNKIYKWSTNGTLTLFAGSGNTGYADGNGIFTSFNNPTALASDAADNIYVWDSGNHLIRKIDQNQDVTTLAGQTYSRPNVDGIGTNATFAYVSKICADGYGNLIFACGTSIRKMDAANNVTTLAGSFSQSGFNDSTGSAALFNGANGVCFSRGTIFVADSANQKIRQISYNPPPPVVLGVGTFLGVKIPGIIGRTYQIQSSADTATWMTNATVRINSSPYLWIDTNGIGRNRFYRAMMLP